MLDETANASDTTGQKVVVARPVKSPSAAPVPQVYYVIKSSSASCPASSGPLLVVLKAPRGFAGSDRARLVVGWICRTSVSVLEAKTTVHVACCIQLTTLHQRSLQTTLRPSFLCLYVLFFCRYTGTMVECIAKKRVRLSKLPYATGLAVRK